jgi:hypothetical protein
VILGIVMVVVAWGFGAYFACKAVQTPWRPERTGTRSIETHLYRRGEYDLYRRLRPWGRARFLVIAAANAFVGVLFLRNLI